MESTKIPKQVCWKCGYVMDRTTEALCDAKPRKGDVSICLCCGALAVFKKNLTLREPTRKEELDWGNWPVILRAQIYRAAIVGDKLKDEQA